MLYSLDWLKAGAEFPPVSERARIETYNVNANAFASEQYDSSTTSSPYYEYIRRITREVGNYQDLVAFPVLLNYQKLIATKTADLVCGEYPIITGKDDKQNDTLNELRETIDFDTKMYATVVDLCRYGDVIWRIYKDTKTSKKTFTVWDIRDWYPIVSQDGTYTITKHVIAWIVTTGTIENPLYELHVQIHTDGEYEYRIYTISQPAVISSATSSGNVATTTIIRTIGKLISTSSHIKTDLKENAIMHIRNIATSGTVFGYDDFTPVDSLIAEIMTRVGQISKILDKHSDPSMTGPSSMLCVDKDTGEKYFRSGDFYGISPGEEAPAYLVWDGRLESAFTELTTLLNQLYILSEMGSALLGAGGAESGQAISGTAMRFKMVNPLAKARRLSNLLTLPVKKLLAITSETLPQNAISVIWQDGLPDDPTEVMTVAQKAQPFIPIKTIIQEMLKRTPEEAVRWVKELDEQAAKAQQRELTASQQGQDGREGKSSTLKSIGQESDKTLDK